MHPEAATSARRKQPPPSRVAASRRHGRLFRHIMVPVDLSARNERALRAALALARAAGSRVTLFHVIQRLTGLAPGELEEFYRLLVARSERNLGKVARAFTSKGVEVNTQVHIGEPAAEIVRATLREVVDLVVMGSHKVTPGRGERGWGTTSYKVGIFCQCPILLVK
jgi:nucleotide-binding universal stress UspA family protein